MKCTNNITTEPRDLLSLVLLPAVTHALMPLAAALGPTTTSTIPLDQTGNIYRPTTQWDYNTSNLWPDIRHQLLSAEYDDVQSTYVHMSNN